MIVYVKAWYGLVIQRLSAYMRGWELDPTAVWLSALEIPGDTLASAHFRMLKKLGSDASEGRQELVLTHTRG